MIKFLLRAIFGLVFFEIGLAIAGLAVISTLIRSIFGGKKAVLKLFNKRTHRSRPESKTGVIKFNSVFKQAFRYIQKFVRVSSVISSPDFDSLVMALELNFGNLLSIL